MMFLKCSSRGFFFTLEVVKVSRTSSGMFSWGSESESGIFFPEKVFEAGVNVPPAV